MPFQWSVQPYRFLYELRDRYTQTVIAAGRKKAYEHAEQAEEWMKQHAPWTDRTEEEREQEALKDPHRVPYPLGARAGLRVRVIEVEGESTAFKKGMDAAKKADRLALGQVNATRKNTLHDIGIRTRSAVKSGEISRQQGSEIYTAAKAKYARLTRLPASRSAVSQFQKQFFSQRTPILAIRFSHHPRVWYAIWLEIAKGGRWGIISKAQEHWGKKFFAEVRRIANLKQYRERIAYGPAPSPKQEFDEYVALQSAKNNKPYEQWSRTTKVRRAKRRKEYDPVKARAWYEQRKLEALEEMDISGKKRLAAQQAEDAMRAVQYQRQQQYSGPRMNLSPTATRTPRQPINTSTVRRLPKRS